MKIIGAAMMDKTMRKMLGGPQALMKMSPLKGTGVKTGGMAPLTRKKGYVASKQNPAFTPNTGGLVKPKKIL